MILRKDATEQKLAGRYYTPYNLAQFIIDWGMEQNITNILEPSCGDGVFLEALVGYDGIFNCTGIEISEEESKVARERLLADDRFEVIHSDFYEFYNKNQSKRYDFILGNPPYIRYQYLREEQRAIQSNLLTSNYMKSNKLINAWVAFTVATISLMAKDSKIAFVIPAEILQVKYAESLRSYLMNELNEITLLTFNELIFDGVDQEVVVLLGKKRSDFEGVHQIKILEFKNVNDLIQNFDEKNYYKPFQNINPTNTKWTKYFLSTEENIVINNLINSAECIKFKDIASVDVGITTGNNSYFCVDRGTARKYDLTNISKPLIARSVNIPGITFDIEDWQRNVEQGAKTFLLDFNLIEDASLSEGQKSYIQYGEQNDEHIGYKCRIRKRWYAIPSIWEPDAFFLRRNYQYPKFVLNNCNAVSTDTMHRVSFLLGTDPRKAILS